MAKYPPPNVPYVEAKYKGGKQTPTLIVMHSTVTTTVEGAALGVANMWHRSTSPMSSAHYVSDEAKTYQCVHDHIVAYHCGYNTNSIGIEMCDDPRNPKNRWNDAPHQKMFERAAQLAATLCLAYGIPARYLSDEELWRWGQNKKVSLGGITTHAQMTRVFKKSTHWDPGEWPKNEFIKRVNRIIDERTKPVSNKKTATFRVATMNVMSLPKNPNLKKTLRSRRGSHLVGFQEVDLADFKRTLLKKWPKAVLGIGRIGDLAPDTYSCPILYGRGRFSLVSSDSEKLYDGSDGISKTRHLTSAIVRHKKTGFLIGMVNIHGPVVKKDSKEAKRRAMRRQARRVTKTKVRELMDLGLPVVVTGDFNTTNNWFGKKFNKRFVKRAANGIDQIIYINGAHQKWRLLSTKKINTPSDHDTFTSRVSLIAK